MDEKKYPFKVTTNEYKYEFLSVNNQRIINKLVILTKVGANEIYNLVLLDELETGELSDSIESKNNDLITILATVIEIINDFLDKNPNATIIFKGSDAKRQRLYRIAINSQLNEISEKFNIFGSIENTISPFEPNVNYEYYLIEKK